VEENEAALKYKESQIKTMQQEHSDKLREKDKTIKELEKEIRKLQWQLAKLREKVGDFELYTAIIILSFHWWETIVVLLQIRYVPILLKKLH